MSYQLNLLSQANRCLVWIAWLWKLYVHCVWREDWLEFVFWILILKCVTRFFFKVTESLQLHDWLIKTTPPIFQSQILHLFSSFSCFCLDLNPQPSAHLARLLTLAPQSSLFVNLTIHTFSVQIFVNSLVFCLCLKRTWKHLNQEPCVHLISVLTIWASNTDPKPSAHLTGVLRSHHSSLFIVIPNEIVLFYLLCFDIFFFFFSFCKCCKSIVYLICITIALCFYYSGAICAYFVIYVLKDISMWLWVALMTHFSRCTIKFIPMPTPDNYTANPAKNIFFPISHYLNSQPLTQPWWAF